jgi:glucosamine--fructose-6-phosphate aminotransferase (isomerizing)
MVLCAQLIASLNSDRALADKINSLPKRFSQALACDWSAWSGRLAGARATFVIGRGFGSALNLN